MAQKFYSPKEVADILGVSKRFVYQLIAENKISYRKLNTLVKFTDDDIEEYVNQDVRPMVNNA